MRRFTQSLLGQVMLSMAAALLIAQGISAVMLYRAASERRELAIMNAAAFQLLAGARRAERAPSQRGERRGPRRLARPLSPAGEGERRIRLPRNIRYREAGQSPLVPGQARQAERETELADILAAQGVDVEDLVVFERPLLDDDLVRAAAERRPRLKARAGATPHDLLVVGLRQAGSGRR